jgi:hypothetical protein
MLCLALVVAACEKGEIKETLVDRTEDLQKTWQDLTRSLQQTAPSREEAQTMAGQEIEKLFTFEYRVQEIPMPSPAAEIEKVMARMGQDRWECFHVESNFEALLLFCKRRPRSYLRLFMRNL